MVGYTPATSTSPDMSRATHHASHANCHAVRCVMCSWSLTFAPTACTAPRLLFTTTSPMHIRRVVSGLRPTLALPPPLVAPLLRSHPSAFSAQPTHRTPQLVPCTRLLAPSVRHSASRHSRRTSVTPPQAGPGFTAFFLGTSRASIALLTVDPLLPLLPPEISTACGGGRSSLASTVDTRLPHG